MDPVGYKRYNKANQKEVTQADIVKGVEWDNGRFVLLTPEELEAAYPRTTQTIEIEAFIPIDQIPFVYLEKPYYTAPINRGMKVYALLREVLAESRLVRGSQSGYCQQAALGAVDAMWPGADPESIALGRRDSYF